MAPSWFQILIVLIFLSGIALAFWCYARILNKAGHSGWWAILMVVPLVNIVAVWVFAFADWPGLQRSTARADGPGSPANADEPSQAQQAQSLEQLLERQTRRTIEAVTSSLPVELQKQIAQQVAQDIAPLRGGDPSSAPTAQEFSELSNVLRRSSQERQAALENGAANENNPVWASAALTESWASARLAAAQGKLSATAFGRLDETVWGFVSDTLSPSEMAEAVAVSHRS